MCQIRGKYSSQSKLGYRKSWLLKRSAREISWTLNVIRNGIYLVLKIYEM